MSPADFTAGVKAMNSKQCLSFWLKVDASGDCWIWTGRRNDKGYGVASAQKRPACAHRIAFVLSGGVLTDGKPQVLHTCDNRPCCNPAHLYAGTIRDNMDDRQNRQRTAKGERN